MSLPQHLIDFLATRPGIKVIQRSDDDFNTTKQLFIVTSDDPLLIIRPQTPEDVAAIVSHLSKSSIPLVIRAGGHDLSTRSVVQDAVQIDIRDLNTVRVAEDKRTARIGGGVLTQELLDGLAEEGLVTSVGNAATVGWCSWAMNGGYGIMSGRYGLGCDQIVGARVALADGRIVDADDRLLKALRGAGPSFGVIVELQIKVYPLTQITAGLIPCESANLSSSLTTYFDKCRSLIDSVGTLPPELYFQPWIMSPPGAPQALLMLQFVWSGPPSDEQEKWLQRIMEIGAGQQEDAVKPTLPADYVRQLSATLPPQLQGGESRTVSIRSLVPSSEAAAIIAKQGPQVTSDWGAIFIHMIHGESVSSSGTHPDSVFASREVHLLVEILGVSFQDEKAKSPAREWCRATHDALKGAEGVMDMEYFPLMQSPALSLEKTYKTEELKFLRELKRELDPTNVFFNPMPLAG